jgi:hypothetical protein
MRAVFNALRSDELLVGIGLVLRSAAEVKGPLEDFQRVQLLSAQSVARLLAAEQRAQAELLAWLKTGLDDALGATEHPAACDARTALAGADSGPAVGEVLGALLEQLPEGDPARPRVRATLRELADREVAALATAAGGG